MATNATTRTQTDTQVKSWLAGVMEQVESLVAIPENFIEPTPPVPETPKGIEGMDDELEETPLPRVLGDMTPTMKALYTLWQDEIYGSFQTIVDAMDPRHHKNVDEIQAQIAAIASRVGTLESMFWEEVKNQFPGIETLGVCKGFKVVELRDRHGVHALLHRAFQGIDGVRSILDGAYWTYKSR